MMTLDYNQFLHIAFPQVILTVAALILLAVDLLLRNASRKVRFATASCLGIAGCAGAIVSLALASGYERILHTVLVSDPLTRLVQIILLVLTILILLLSIDSTFTPHIGEYVLLILFATVGMMFLVQSQDLISLFVSLELFSLCLYILTGFDKPRARSSEAALKYFLFGAMSAAFLLYGFSILYGMSSSTLLPVIGESIRSHKHNPLSLLALVMVVAGLGFKVAAAPFHFWAPDVYEGAPTPVAAFIASSSKVASFFIFFLVMFVAFRGVEGGVRFRQPVSGWVPALVVIAVFSMLLGNLAAIVQSSLRRLMAYSAVSHAGYMLLALVAHSPGAFAGLLYYVATYALTTVGVFAVLQAHERSVLSKQLPGLGADRIDSLAGLSRRSPLLAACLAIFLLSLAGIPPLPGFFAKFYLFTAVLGASPGSHLSLTLVALAVLMSAVSLYYYLRILKSAYVAEAPVDLGYVTPPMLTRLVVGAIAAAVLFLGCVPSLLVDWIAASVRAVTS